MKIRTYLLVNIYEDTFVRYYINFATNCYILATIIKVIIEVSFTQSSGLFLVNGQ